MAITTDTDRIRELNDKPRQDLSTGYAVITPGIAALGQEAVERLVKTIQVFDDFHHANDPHQEHDFGFRRPHDLFQDRLLRRNPIGAFAGRC